MYNIGGVDVDITEEEHHRYLSLNQQLGEEVYFKNLFNVDKDGCIISISVTKSVPWSVIFFAQQLMINQRLRFTDIAFKEINGIKKELLDIRKILEEK